VPRKHQLHVEVRHHIQAPEELAGGVRRPAVVVEERHAAEQMVPGQEQAAVGLVKDHVRRRVPGRLVHLKAAQVGVHLHPGQQVAVRQDDLRDPVAPALPLGLVTGEGIGRHPTLPCHLEAPFEGPLGIRRRPRHVAVVGVHPQLAPRSRDDRPGQSVVVRVRVGAHQQAHVLQPQPGLVERPLELAQPAGLVQAGVHEHHSVARGDRERVHMWHSRPGQREPQSPEPR
jgi:hypothetical protein